MRVSFETRLPLRPAGKKEQTFRDNPNFGRVMSRPKNNRAQFLQSNYVGFFLPLDLHSWTSLVES